MKKRSNKKKCAEWPFGPRSGQESPTLGAKSINQSCLPSTLTNRLASTFPVSNMAHPRPARQPSVKSIGNFHGLKDFRMAAPLSRILNSGALCTEAEVKAWIAEQEGTPVAKLKEGPVVVR